MDAEKIIERLDQLEALLRVNQDMPLTEEQAAEYLHLSHRHMLRLRSKAAISFHCLGGGEKRAGKILYYRRDLDEWIRRHRRQAV